MAISNISSKNIYRASDIKDYAVSLASDLRWNTNTPGNTLYPCIPFNIVEDNTYWSPKGKHIEGASLGTTRMIWRVASGALSLASMEHFLENSRVTVLTLGKFTVGVQAYIAGDVLLDFLNLSSLTNEINQVKRLTEKESSNTSQKASLYAHDALHNIQRQMQEYTTVKTLCLSGLLSAYFIPVEIVVGYVIPAIAALGLCESIVYTYRDYQNLSMATKYLEEEGHLKYGS